MQPPSHLSLVIPGASPENGFDGRQKGRPIESTTLTQHHDIEQSLRDMANSTQTVRDVMAGEKRLEDSHEQAFIEHEERMVAIQPSAQAVSDLQSHIDIYLSVDQPPFVGSSPLTFSCWTQR
jgi:hypothetical protein